MSTRLGGTLLPCLQENNTREKNLPLTVYHSDQFYRPDAMLTHLRQPSLALIMLGHNHPQKIGPWRLGKTLGRGATGRVLLATHDQTGQRAAVKVVLKLELNDDYPDGDAGGLPYGIEREIIIMKLLTHPNVLQLYDVWETSKALYLVLEYVEGGELFDLLVERGPLHEQEAIKYFRQIILGTAYCHALGICHRDLKPENLLLDADLNVKLADFGMAALESNGKLLETLCGLPHYAAPEIVLGLKYHGAALDVWLCGVILFALLSGRLPFDDENIRNLLLKVQAGHFEMPYDLSPEAQDLIDQMLTVDPIDRITTEKVLQHPLLHKYPISLEDLISVKLLPHPETAYKLLGLEKNIDRQILDNLMILWKDRSADDIVRLLLEPGANPEKTFYALLLRYRHNNSDLNHLLPRKLRQLSLLGLWLLKLTPKKKRASQIAVLRPLLFQYLGLVVQTSDRMLRTSLGTHRNSLGGGLSVAGGRTDNSILPIKLPRALPTKRRLPKKDTKTQRSLVGVPRNIYQEIVDAQTIGKDTQPSLPHTQTVSYGGHQILGHPLPIKELDSPQIKAHKIAHEQAAGIAAAAGIGLAVVKQDATMGLFDDSLVLANLTTAPAPGEGPRDGPPVVDEVTRDLLALAHIRSLKLIESLLRTGQTGKISKLSSRNRMLVALKRRLAASAPPVTANPGGLKRNLITMKLLLTYAKLAGETDWEYMDKLTKRTLATFAQLCDKIFNQEEVTADEEQLLDEEERRAREYERLMEQERKKREAELIARRELEKHKKRQKRRSLMSLKKLSIIVKEDSHDYDTNNDSLIISPEEIAQLKHARFGGQGSADLSRRATPDLLRRPVLRLDPLWTAYDNNKLERAKDALDHELINGKRPKLYAGRRKPTPRIHEDEQRYSLALDRRGSDRYRNPLTRYDGHDYEPVEKRDRRVLSGEQRDRRVLSGEQRNRRVLSGEQRDRRVLSGERERRSSKRESQYDDYDRYTQRDSYGEFEDEFDEEEDRYYGRRRSEGRASRRESRDPGYDPRRGSHYYPDDYDVRRGQYPVSGPPPLADDASGNLEIIEDLDDTCDQTTEIHPQRQRQSVVAARKATREAIEGSEDYPATGVNGFKSAGIHDRPTLIASVHIPKVTRKLRGFSGSTKRLLVLLQYLTKELFRDLSLILKDEDAPATNHRNSLTSGLALATAPRALYAERFEEAEEDSVENGEYRELVYRELHYYNGDTQGRSALYYDSLEFREQAYSHPERGLVYLTALRVSRKYRDPRYQLVGPRPKSQLPNLPDDSNEDNDGLDDLTFNQPSIDAEEINGDEVPLGHKGSLLDAPERKRRPLDVDEDDQDDGFDFVTDDSLNRPGRVEAGEEATDTQEVTEMPSVALDIINADATATTSVDDTDEYTFATHKHPRGPQPPNFDNVTEEEDTNVFDHIKLPKNNGNGTIKVPAAESSKAATNASTATTAAPKPRGVNDSAMGPGRTGRRLKPLVIAPKSDATAQPPSKQKVMGSNENPSPHVNGNINGNANGNVNGNAQQKNEQPGMSNGTLGLPKVRKQLLLLPVVPPKMGAVANGQASPATTMVPSPALTGKTAVDKVEEHVTKPLQDSTNRVRPTANDGQQQQPPANEERRSGSLFFRKLSWGTRKVTEETQQASRNTTPGLSLRKPVVEEDMPKKLFFRWFSLDQHDPDDIRRFETILPRPEMLAALMLLLTQWLNFGVKDLREDRVRLTITGGISRLNQFNLKSCKFRIKVSPRGDGQKSLIVCARVKGLKTLCDTLFNEIEKVLRKEKVLDEGLA